MIQKVAKSKCKALMHAKTILAFPDSEKQIPAFAYLGSHVHFSVLSKTVRHKFAEILFLRSGIERHCSGLGHVRVSKHVSSDLELRGRGAHQVDRGSRAARHVAHALGPALPAILRAAGRTAYRAMGTFLNWSQFD